MKALRVLVLTGLALMLAAAIAQPAIAASKYTIIGWFPVNAPEDPTNGYFSQPNPEANFQKACARGTNGSDARVKVGAPVRILNGNNVVVGKGRIAQAHWESDSGSTGACYYQIVAKNLPRSNFYCPLIFDEALYRAELGDADRNGVIGNYEDAIGYFGPNWPLADYPGAPTAEEKAAKKRICRTG